MSAKVYVGQFLYRQFFLKYRSKMFHPTRESILEHNRWESSRCKSDLTPTLARLSRCLALCPISGIRGVWPSPWCNRDEGSSEFSLIEINTINPTLLSSFQDTGRSRGMHITSVTLTLISQYIRHAPSCFSYIIKALDSSPIPPVKKQMLLSVRCTNKSSMGEELSTYEYWTHLNWAWSDYLYRVNLANVKPNYWRGLKVVLLVRRGPNMSFRVFSLLTSHGMLWN